MKSKLYKKYRASKYKHKTNAISFGSETALVEIQQRIGRTLNVHHIEHNRGQWIFCELKGNN